MSGLMWTQVLLVLTTLLQVSDLLRSSELYPAAVVELGSAVILPCPGLKENSGCSGVSWAFNRFQHPDLDQDQRQELMRELVRNGQCVEGSGRMELMMNCSLLLHTVNEEDVGLYSCSHPHPAPKRGRLSVPLSVIKRFGKDALGELLSCALSSPDSGRFRLRSFKYRSQKVTRGQARSNRPLCSVMDSLSGTVWRFWNTESFSEEASSGSHGLRGSGAAVAFVLSVLLLFNSSC